jgi:plastocyanin
MPAPTRLILASAAAALVLSACGGAESDTTTADAGGDAGGSDAGAVTVVASEFTFDPDELSFPSGTTVRVDNQGVIEHDLVVEGHEEETEIYAAAGQSEEGTIDLPSGSYTFYCSIPGHRASGMEGSLTIE